MEKRGLALTSSPQMGVEEGSSDSHLSQSTMSDEQINDLLHSLFEPKDNDELIHAIQFVRKEVTKNNYHLVELLAERNFLGLLASVLDGADGNNQIEYEVLWLICNMAVLSEDH